MPVPSPERPHTTAVSPDNYGANFAFFLNKALSRHSCHDRSPKPVYSVAELARLVGRDPYTVRAWIKAGRVRATRLPGTGARGRLQIAREEVERVLADGLLDAGSRPTEVRA